MKYQSLFYFFKFLVNVEMQRALWEANFHTKRTYDSRIMNFFSFRTKLGQLKYFLFFQDIFCQFFCNIFLIKILLKLLTNPSCSTHEFYKGKLQSLTKRSFSNRVICKVSPKTPICIFKEKKQLWRISLNWQYFIILASIPKLWHFHSLDQALQILYLSWMSKIYNSPSFLKSRIVVDFFLMWSEIYMDFRN